MHVRRLHVVQIMLLSAVLAAGTATAAPVTALTVAVITPSLIDAPMVVGVAAGIFAKHGLEMHIRPVASGFEAVQEVTDGTVQIGASAATALAQTIGQGARLKGIVVSNGDATGNVPTDSYVAVVARGASGIRESHLEDLRGKRIGVRRGSDFHQYLFAALAAKGLDPLSDVTIVPPVNALAALRSGAMDAVVSPEPGASQIRGSVPGAVLVQQGGNYMQFLEVRSVSARYLATHPGTIKRYITAFAEAAQFIRTHPDEAADIMIREQVKGLDRSLVRTALGSLHPDVRISKVTARAAQEGAGFAVRIGALKQSPTFEEMFDPRILRQVEREHPELFRDLPPIPDALKL